MNIAMFTNTYYPSVGGIERSIDIFAAEMRRRGHDVLLVVPQYKGVTDSTEEVLRVPAIKQINGTPHSIVLGFPSELAERVKAFKPDIIHSHQPFLLGDSAVRMARVLDVPVIYTNHTFMERYLHWFPMDWGILHDIALKLPVAYANLVDHVIAPTNSVAEIMRERGVKTTISCIPTGIDAEFFASGDRANFRQQHDLQPEHFVVGHLGRLNEEKNLSYLADVVLDFVAKEPERRRFLLAGEGNLVEMFKQRFAEHNLTEQLVYVGLLAGKACAHAYAAMDIFVFTSLSDTQGLVLSEAMAAGNPVFALDATGVRDMITHGENGILLPAEASPQEFSAEMERAIADESLFNRMRNNVVTAAGKVSIPVCTQAMLDLYTVLIERKGRVADERLSHWEKLCKQWRIEKELMQEKLECL